MSKSVKRGPLYWVLRVVRLLLVAYGTLVLFACSMADRMIFMPPSASYKLGDEGLVQFGEGKVFSGFYFPAEKTDAPVLLWGHGNGEDAGHVRDLAKEFQRQGLGVLAYDYAGYGLSEGKPSEEGAYRAVEAAFEYLKNEQGVSPQKMVALGQSVGGGPSTYLAAKGEVSGLVLISPFKSAFRVVTKVKILPWDRFDNLKRMKGLPVPLLLFHGDEDNVIGFEHGQALYERHPGPKKMVPLKNAGHNDLWATYFDEVVDEVVTFANSL